MDGLRRKERELEETGKREELADVRREAERVERELREFSHQSQHEEIARRLEHMRAAVEHLNHAGLPDIAKHVAERAEATEKELQKHRQNQGGEAMHEIMKQIEELRREVGRLREDVNQLKEKR